MHGVWGTRSAFDPGLYPADPEFMEAMFGAEAAYMSSSCREVFEAAVSGDPVG